MINNVYIISKMGERTSRLDHRIWLAIYICIITNVFLYQQISCQLVNMTSPAIFICALDIEIHKKFDLQINIFNLKN